MTKVRSFKKEYAQELLRIAQGDLQSANVLKKSSDGRRENILFLVQQCIEKSLKAVLCHLGLPVPLVHDLALLLDHFPKDCAVPGRESMADLSQFADIRRYEEGRFVFTDEEIMASVQLADSTLKWAETQTQTQTQTKTKT